MSVDRSEIPGPWTAGYARGDGVRLHYVQAGAGPAVVMLHGFPEFWYSWRRQIPALAAAGFRAIAPDLRGYNLSDRPDAIAAYRVESLVADVEALAADLGERRIHLVGHDWGGVIAWYTAMLRPDLVQRLVIVNAPHPAAYRRELTRSTQALRSWYAGFFQLPWLPEAVFRIGNSVVLRRVFRDGPVRRGANDDQDVRLHVEAMRRPGALTAAINFYRALRRHPPALPDRESRRIRAPTMVVWGERDRYLVPGLTDGLERWVPDVRVERLPGVSHWVQADAPDELNRLLIEFLGEPTAT
jgi:epoxide hydrolase 4